MTDFLKTVDTWFLILAVLLLGYYFVWSLQRLLQSLLQSIDELKSLIKDLFNHKSDHENRIVALETRCDLMHGDDVREPGRRYYDPGHKDCQK